MILTDKEINDVWGKIEVTRFTHPDADKPDFQFFDQGIYGEAIAKAQLRVVAEWWSEPCLHGFHTVEDNVPKSCCTLCLDEFLQSLLEEVKE